MKWPRLTRIVCLSLTFFTLSFSFADPTLIHAESTEPFAPFSVEGNPDEEYHFEQLFPLFKYVRPRALKIYENRDRSREYHNWELCDRKDGVYDQRDYKCSVNNQTGDIEDTCDGGDVAICVRGTKDVVETRHSDPNGGCSAQADPEKTGVTWGKCSYNQRPDLGRTIKGADFAAEAPIYPKLQSEDLAFTNIGTSNIISWGSQYLNSDFCEIALRKIIVVRRAKQTKATLAQTGEWPLGWVDWGYQVGIDHDRNPDTPTSGTKTLLEIDSELPDGIAAAAFGMIEQLDDMYMNPGNYVLLDGIGETKKAICKDVEKEANKLNPDEWYIDLMSAPLYAPSFRQGFIRPTICVWNVCCPKNPDKCWIPDIFLIGVKRGLYYDTSVSQAFNAALDQFFMSLPLDEAMAQFRKSLASNNPLIRFASSASEFAVPSRIHEKLYEEMKDGCLKYVPWSNWKYFTQWIDYLEPDAFLGPNKTCPNYKLQPTLTKDLASSYPEPNVSWLLKFIFSRWESDPIDEVEEIKRHLVTIPEAMGQSIKELQQGFYDTRDTLIDLDAARDFNEDLSSTIDDDTEEKLYVGKNMNPADARRRFANWTCEDPMFSSQLETSVEDYALGTRIGCDRTLNAPGTTPNGQCSPDKFAAIIEDSPWSTVPSNVSSIVMNSAMFENGQLKPELEEVYAAAAEATGVPCEVLAGHHFEEATTCFTSTGNPEECSIANGGPVKEQGGLAKTAESATIGLLRHPINTTKLLITAISNFNGGGNSNCQANFPGGNIPYGGCPRQFQGEDDPYAMNLIDGKHTNMFLLYCGDSTPCIPPKPYGNDRPGVFPVALVVHEYLKTRTPNTSPRPSSGLSNNLGGIIDPGDGYSVFKPETCGEGSLATALGCLPYAYRPFVTTLLRFLVGISGGISLSVMLFGVFRMMSSSGDPKQIQSGRDLFTAGIAGLLFVIFSVALLRLVAADILKLPGF